MHSSRDVLSCPVQGWEWAQDLYHADKPHWGYKSMTVGDVLKVNVRPQT